MCFKNEGRCIAGLVLLQGQRYFNWACFQNCKYSWGMFFLDMSWPSTSIRKVRIKLLVIFTVTAFCLTY